MALKKYLTFSRNGIQLLGAKLTVATGVALLAFLFVASVVAGDMVGALWGVACGAFALRDASPIQLIRDLMRILTYGAGALAAIWGAFLGSYAFAVVFGAAVGILAAWKYAIKPTMIARKADQAGAPTASTDN